MTLRCDADCRARSRAVVGRIKAARVLTGPSAMMLSRRAPDPCKSWLVKMMFMFMPSDWPSGSVPAGQMTSPNRPLTANQTPRKNI
jgi:hypothetical protein